MSEEQQPQGQQLNLQKIYLKDISFETPNSPQIFTQEWQPEVNVDLSTSGQPIAEHVYEAVLSLTVTAKVGEQTAFLAEVHQAGIFDVQGFTEEQTSHILGVFCPSTLFPYAREAISELVSKGGFPQMLLNPVNFDALYAQSQQNQAEAH